MKNFFKNLFDDNNTINEKSVVGFLAFVMRHTEAGISQQLVQPA